MSTKIINILQDDDFGGILKIFQETPAKEVIFVLPRRHEAFSSEEHFAVLSEMAKENEKNVLILASNPEINEMALRYNIGVLTSAKVTSKNSSKKKKIVQEPVVELKPEVVPAEEPEDDESDTVSLDPEEPNRMMVDIVQPKTKEDETFEVKIDEKAEDQPFEVEIKKDNRDILDEIQSVWQSKETDRSFSKSDVRPDDRYVPPAFIKNGFRVDFPPFLRFLRKPMVLLGIAVCVLFGAVIYVSTGSAKIIIKPRSQPLDLSLKVSTSDSFQALDLDGKKIPGQLFSIEKRVEQVFKATGERDVAQKAKGKLVVYNEYGTTPQTLIATTRFESSNGLVFRTLKTVTVPGTRVENGKITPGMVEVEVIADKAGDTYNIGSGRFTIPAFKEKGDMDRYGKFYGVSEEAMKGGIVGKAKVVLERDYLDAKKTIEDRIISEINQDLQSQSAGLKILGASQPSVKEIISTAQIDEAVDEFTVSGIAEIQTVGFKESDLHDLISRYVGNINNLTVLPEKLKIDFSDSQFNTTDKVLQFVVSVKGLAYARIDEEKVISGLIGKNEDSIKEYAKSIEGVVSTRVILSPFWVRKVPDNKDKINLEIQYE